METINWCGYDWLTSEEWGQIHPDKPWNWYDPACVSVDPDSDDLVLGVRWNPREFDLPGKGIVRSNWGIGLVSCKTYFKYGTFSVYASLPRGRGLWPAFWIYDHNDWPPEVDIFEGYSGRRGDYRNGILKRIFYTYAIESCFHSHMDLPIPRIRPMAPSRCMLKAAAQGGKFDPFEFNRYSLSWTPDGLIFAINNIVVREIRDKEIINYLKDRKMRVVLNTHIHGPFQNDFIQKSPFRIKSFYYNPL